MRVREFFTDVYNDIVFGFTLAVDVYKCLKEEKSKERLCLTLA